MFFNSIPYVVISYSDFVNNNSFNNVSVHFEKKLISKRGKCILQSKVKFNIINTSDDNLATTVIIIIFCGRMILKLITILLLPEQLNYFPYNRTMVVNSFSIL